MKKKKLVLIQSSPYDHERKPIKKSKLYCNYFGTYAMLYIFIFGLYKRTLKDG